MGVALPENARAKAENSLTNNAWFTAWYNVYDYDARVTKGQQTVAVSKTSFDAIRIIRCGVENLLDSGGLLTANPLEPTVSRSLQDIRAARQDNWTRHQARMQELKRRRRVRTVDTYLHHAIKIYASQHREEHAVIAKEIPDKKRVK